jgi:hypothetical protein
MQPAAADVHTPAVPGHPYQVKTAQYRKMSNAAPRSLFSNRPPFCRIASAVLGIAAIAGASVLFDARNAGVQAQTLIAPGSKAASPQPRADEHANALGYKHAKKQSNACSDFGLGFVQLPGTDACVRIGGGVTIGGTTSR